MKDEFRKYARSRGISSLNLDRFESQTRAYINPTIIEERQLNVAQMDVFSRLMMDRILFLGTAINDEVVENKINMGMSYDKEREGIFYFRYKEYHVLFSSDGDGAFGAFILWVENFPAGG